MNGPDNLLEAPIKPAPLPEVRNHTAFPSQYFQMVDVAGQIFHVMVSRLTYTLRKVDAEGCLVLADSQRPLVATDSFSGEPNLSSVAAGGGGAEVDAASRRSEGAVMVRAGPLGRRGRR